MGLLIAAASTSIVLAAFYRVTQLPNYHQRQHVYYDDDGEAAPAEHQENQDRTARILVVLFALATLLLSAWNWVVQGHDARLTIITISWVLCQPGRLSTCLIEFADDHCCGFFLACSTVATEATTLRYRFAGSCFITHVVARFSNHYCQ